MASLASAAAASTCRRPSPRWRRAALSYVLEVVQNCLPQRVPSLLDWVLNSAGAMAGALLGLLARTRSARSGWCSARASAGSSQRSAGGLALLLLWPLGLLFPTPVPLGLGQVWERVARGAAATRSSSGRRRFDGCSGLTPRRPCRSALSPPAEVLVVALGLLAPCLLAFAIARPGWRRVVLALGAAALGFGATTLVDGAELRPGARAGLAAPATSLAGLGARRRCSRAARCAAAAAWPPASGWSC